MKHKKRLAAGIAAFAVLTLLSHTGMTRGAAEALSEQVLAAAPEAIQQEGTENIEVGNLPVYDYRQQEIELENEGQRIYGLLISLIQRRKRFRWSFAPMGLAVPIARMLPMPSSWLAMELQPTALIFAAAEVPQAKAIPRKCLL